MIFSAKVKKIHLVVVIIVFLIVGGFSWLAISNYNLENSINFENPKCYREIVSFLDDLGWKISKKPIEVEEVIVPDDFDDIYKKYNKIQLEAGFNLEPYKNTKFTRYTYNVLNFDLLELQDESVRANILILDNKIIGGDICTVSLRGFMIPLCDKKDANNYLV